MKASQHFGTLPFFFFSRLACITLSSRRNKRRDRIFFTCVPYPPLFTLSPARTRNPRNFFSGPKRRRLWRHHAKPRFLYLSPREEEDSPRLSTGGGKGTGQKRRKEKMWERRSKESETEVFFQGKWGNRKGKKWKRRQREEEEGSRKRAEDPIPPLNLKARRLSVATETSA